MHDPVLWSLPIFFGCGKYVRVHVFLLATMVLAVVAASLLRERTAGFAIAGAVLLASAIDAVGHLIAAAWQKKTVTPLVLGPLGAWGAWPDLGTARQTAIVIAGGPLANLLACLGTLLGLWLYGDGQLAELASAEPTIRWRGMDIQEFARLFCWLNGIMAAVTVLPSYPLDGGRFLSALIATTGWLPFASLLGPNSPLAGRGALLNEKMGRAAIVALAGRITTFVLTILAIAFAAQEESATWAPLAILAMTIYFALRSASMDDLAPNYQTPVALLMRIPEHPEELPENFNALPSPLTEHWQSERKESRARRSAETANVEQNEMEQRKEDDAERLDEILVKWQSLGPDSLTEEERALLARMSETFRRRRDEKIR